MVGDKEILKYIYENIDMGISAMETLEKNLEGTDNKIKSNVSKSLLEYKSFEKRCKKLIKKNKISVDKAGFMQVMMAKVGSKMEMMRDNSDSKLAEIIIQGYNMGITSISKKLNAYQGDVSKEVMRLAEDYKKIMKRGIEDIKGFL